MWRRAGYAISTAVVARGDNGKWQPAYASVLGDFASGAISNLYYPAENRNGAGLTIENGFLAIASDAATNLLQEFLLKKISTGVKKSSAGGICCRALASGLKPDFVVVIGTAEAVRLREAAVGGLAALPGGGAFSEEGGEAFLFVGGGAEAAEDVGFDGEGFG